MSNPPGVIPVHLPEESPKPNGTNGAVPSKHQPATGSFPDPGNSPIAPGKSSLWPAVFGWLVIAALAGGGWYYRSAWWPLVEPYLSGGKPAGTKPVRIVPVTAAVVRQRDMPLYLNGLGTVTAFKTVTVRSRVEGELVSVAFTEGQMVKEGDLLAEIDPRPFEVQLAQAEGQLARDGATLKTARVTLSRYEGLIAAKSIAAQQYDDQVSLVNQTMAAMQSDEAMVANAKLQLTYSRIQAPISGRIGLRLVDQGNIVRANDPTGLAVITQLQPIALVFTIPQDDISRVQKRSLEEMELSVDAFDRDFKLKLASGHLLAIDNQVDATTGTVRLKARFENKDGMLFPNQFVNARLLVDSKPNAIVVPSAAVQRGPMSMFVYVVKTEKSEKADETIETVELRNVVTGPAEGSETSIESGLTPGETVVTDGIDKLQPGAKVSTRAPGNRGEKSGQPGKVQSNREENEKTTPEKGLMKGESPINNGSAPESGRQNGEKPLTKAAKPADGDPKPEQPGPDPKLEPAARPVEDKQARDTQ